MLVNAKRVVNASADADRPRWVFGVNAIARRLEVDPTSVRELYLQHGDSPRRAALARAAGTAGIHLREADGTTLSRLTGSDGHQGVAALADPYRYRDLVDVLAGDPGPLLLLDQVQDPHNFGALIRTAAAAGMAAILIPRHGAVGVSPAAEKVAAGAVNDIAICRVANVHRCLIELRTHGYWSIGLTPRDGQDLFALEWPEKPVLVLGGEGGLRPLVEQTCDFRASIPVRSAVESLNASVAGALAMYEASRQLRRLDRS
jgi:23S rRNA (guanosine2251-2'-O)-methyltransferase